MKLLENLDQVLEQSDTIRRRLNDFSPQLADCSGLLDWCENTMVFVMSSDGQHIMISSKETKEKSEWQVKINGKEKNYDTPEEAFRALNNIVSAAPEHDPLGFPKFKDSLERQVTWLERIKAYLSKHAPHLLTSENTIHVKSRRIFTVIKMDPFSSISLDLPLLAEDHQFDVKMCENLIQSYESLEEALGEFIHQVENIRCY